MTRNMIFYVTKPSIFLYEFRFDESLENKEDFPFVEFLPLFSILRLLKGREDLGRWILHSWIISHLDQDSKKAVESNFCWQNKPEDALCQKSELFLSLGS